MEDAPELFVTPESEQSEAVAVSGNVQALLDLMARNPLHREIYLQIIEFCEVRRLLGDVEAMVADCSGFSLTAQTPFRLIGHRGARPPNRRRGSYRRVGPAAAAELFRGHAGTLRRPGMG